MLASLIERFRRDRRLTRAARDMAAARAEGRATSGTPGAARLEAAIAAAGAFTLPETDQQPSLADMLLSRRALFGGGALAAGLAAVLVALVWLPVGTGPDTFRTGIGETHTYELADGSSVFLSGNTSIETRFTDEARQITLVSGEAYFEVAHDEARPFTVSTEGLSVTAVGTAFSVASSGTPSVDVLEGVVRVETAGDTSGSEGVLLPAGERAVAGLDGLERSEARSDRVRMLMNGRVLLREQSLEDAVSEFAPFSTLRIEIADEALAGETVSGVFDTDGIDDFLLAVESLLDVRVMRYGNAAVIRPAPPESSGG